MKSLFLAALSCLVLLVPQYELQAQISWSPSVPLIAGGDNTDFISQNGTFVMGIAPGGVGDDAGVVATVGTAQFFVTDQGSGEPDGTITSVTSTQNGVLFTGAFTRVQAPTFAPGETPGEFTDSSVGSLIQPATWNHAFAAGEPTVTLSGLTPDDTYEIQIIINDARNGRSENWQIAFTSGSDDLVGTVAKLSNREAGTDLNLPENSAGDFVIGTFVADASGTQTFQMNATRGGNLPADQFIVGETIDIRSNDPPGADRGGTTQINAMQLRNISDVTGGILGDSNVDGMVDFDDIAPFIGFLASGDFQFQSDIDGNLVVDFDDIAGFIAILASP